MTKQARDMSRATNFEVRALDQAGIDQARVLAYDAYIVGEGWRLHPNDSAGLRVVQSSRGQKMLTCNYDEVSTWFGVYSGDELIACTRASGRLNGHLDADAYPEAVKIRELTHPYSNIVEWGRSILHPAHRGQGLFPILCKTVLEEAKRRELAVLTTTRLDGVSIALTKWGFPEAKGAAG